MLHPSALCPSRGRYNDPFSQQQHLKDIYVGSEAAANKAQLELSYPMSNGVVQDWDDMHLVWDHAFRRVPPPPPRHTPA